MANSTRYRTDANQFPRIDTKSQRCRWDGCRSEQFLALPLCLEHALCTAQFLREVFLHHNPVIDTQQRTQCFVYYVMTGPNTVKIGYTSDLRQRLNSLRTELQYVVALEIGGRELEKERHQQFAMQRIGRKEDFTLNEALKQHIDQLQTKRDELIALATTYPLPKTE